MPTNEPATPSVTRRRLLLGAAGLGGIAAVGGLGYAVAPAGLKNRLGLGPDPFIPSAREGQVHLETVSSSARGKDVELFTAVPHGHGDGAGLPVVVVLHGASATASDFREFGLGRFLTQAVLDGAPPFVLAGADGGVLRWEKDPSSDDDPQQMLATEMPGWLADRGYDADRLALWGWSMGGYGSLRLAQAQPDYAMAVAAFSPAFGTGDPLFTDVEALADVPLGIWCGTDDPLHEPIKVFVEALPTPPEVASYSAGGHTRIYWNDHTLEAFDYLAAHLSG